MIEPKIVPVPEKMQKFYGKGQMLHPEMRMVIALIELIPRGKVMTIDMLAKQLAVTYGADVTCPMRTGNLIKRLSKTESEIPFWRVIRKDGCLIKLENLSNWASILEKEGLSLEFMNSNQIRVSATENQFFTFSETH